eukprot:1829381-Amphidinium_carterae.1
MVQFPELVLKRTRSRTQTVDSFNDYYCNKSRRASETIERTTESLHATAYAFGLEMSRLGIELPHMCKALVTRIYQCLTKPA